MRVQRLALAFALLTAGLAAGSLGPAEPAGAACAPATRSMGGWFVGEDSRRISGAVGIVLLDAAGRAIDRFGCPSAGGYSLVVGVNMTPDGCCALLPPEGADPGDGRYANTWRADGLPANAFSAWVETYPKSNRDYAINDYSRYGGAMRRGVPVGLGVHVWLPLGCGLGGNNGDVTGRATRSGAPAPLRSVVAFSRAPEGRGQILGFVASNDVSGGSFEVPQLEPNQTYALEFNLADGSHYWYEHNYGIGVPVAPCITTTRAFVLHPNGLATAVDAATSGPSGIEYGGGRLLFFRGGDGGLWQKAGAEGAASSHGGQIIGEPDVTTRSGGRIDVVARGVDNSVWYRAYTGTGWAPWRDLGGATGYPPSVVSWGSGRLDVFATGADHRLWHRWSPNGLSWSAWEPLGGYLSAGPDAASWAANRLDIASRGLDGGVWHLAWAGRWTPWEGLGGQVLGGQAAVAPGVNRLDIVARGTNNGVFIRSWTGAGWTPWGSLSGGATDADPDATRAGARTTVFVRGGNGFMYAAVRPSAGAPYGGWAWLAP